MLLERLAQGLSRPLLPEAKGRSVGQHSPNVGGADLGGLVILRPQPRESCRRGRRQGCTRAEVHHSDSAGKAWRKQG